MEAQYQVIARRYRPRGFEEVVGQQATAATLRNAIVADRLAHAYLFCGPRGIGKTSMARIFARALNCSAAFDRSRPQEEWGRPCGECETCLAVHEGDDIDVIEMDGASNRGIEDVREIIDGVKFAPTRSRYKIYLVDEVHMLTREAFNAFLKVLEEPPAHVKFIFATTEPHKIPDTVLSRCQRFDFHPIRIDDIVERLRQICEAENVTPEEGLLERVARYSKGGLRDSQTLLDQLISFSRDTLRIEDLERITGRITEDRLEQLVEAMLGRQSATALQILGECFDGGVDPAVLLEQLLEALRSELFAAVAEDARSARVDHLGGALQILLETASRLKGSPLPQLAVELAVVKLARLESVVSVEETIGWLKRFEEMARSGERVPVASPPRAPAASAPPREAPSREAPSREAPSREAPPRETPRGDIPPAVGDRLKTPPQSEAEPAPIAPAESVAAPPAADSPPRAAAATSGPPASDDASTGSPQQPASFERLRALWDQIMIEFRQSAPHIQAFLKNARVEPAGDGCIAVCLPSPFTVKQLSDAERRKRLEATIAEVSGASWRVEVRLDESLPRDDTASQAPEESLREHPAVKKTIEIFRGRPI